MIVSHDSKNRIRLDMMNELRDEIDRVLSGVSQTYDASEFMRGLVHAYSDVLYMIDRNILELTDQDAA